MSLSEATLANESLTMEDTDVYNNTYYGEYYDYAVSSSTESYYIDRVGCIPVSLLGIVGNLVSLAVWNSQSTYNATIFLFKYLAVWDTAFLVSVIPVIFLYEFDPWGKPTIVLNTLSVLAKLESVHTTLLIAFTRWLAVYRPVHVHTGSLLKRRHVLVACLVVFVWCLAITAVFLTFHLIPEPSKAWVHGWTAVHIVGLAVPVLPLIVFNVLLLIKIRTPFSPASTKTEQQQSSTWGSTQRLTAAILSMSVFSVVAYTIGETVTVVHWLGHWSNGGNLFMTLQSAFELLQVVNSSVNIIFYFAFSRNFRSSFTKCFKRCVLRGRAVSLRQQVPLSEDKGESSSSRTATETVALSTNPPQQRLCNNSFLASTVLSANIGP